MSTLDFNLFGYGSIDMFCSATFDRTPKEFRIEMLSEYLNDNLSNVIWVYEVNE